MEKIERQHHPYWVWEDYKNGFYDNCSGEQKKEKIQKVVEMFSDPVKTEIYMEKVIKEWFYSCEQNLTNNGMNKIAYIGQAACCIYDGIPSTITMEAWSSVPSEFQLIANEIAQSKVDKWEKYYVEVKKQVSQDNKC